MNISPSGSGLGLTPGRTTSRVINRSGMAVTKGTILCLDMLNSTASEVDPAVFGIVGNRKSVWANVTFSFAGTTNNASRRNLYCVALESAADNAELSVLWQGIDFVRCTTSGAVTLGDTYISSSPSAMTNGVVALTSASPAAIIKQIGWPLEAIGGAITDQLVLCFFDGIEGA